MFFGIVFFSFFFLSNPKLETFSSVFFWKFYGAYYGDIDAYHILLVQPNIFVIFFKKHNALSSNSIIKNFTFKLSFSLHFLF